MTKKGPVSCILSEHQALSTRDKRRVLGPGTRETAINNKISGGDANMYLLSTG
jgi:hypothetical protein